jgi:hypothetical protein
MIAVVGLRLGYLLARRLLGGLVLLSRTDAAKEVEILRCVIRWPFCAARSAARHVLNDYQEHFNLHRPYRALAQAAPLRPLPSVPPDPNACIVRQDRLDGLIHEYAQVA